jgi:hypothetical protein
MRGFYRASKIGDWWAVPDNLVPPLYVAHLDAKSIRVTEGGGWFSPTDAVNLVMIGTFCTKGRAHVECDAPGVTDAFKVFAPADVPATAGSYCTFHSTCSKEMKVSPLPGWTL